MQAAVLISPATNTDMSWSTIRSKKWYHHWLLWILLILAVATFFSWPKVKGRYLRWSAGRQVRCAAEFVAQGDYARAVIAARNALGANPMDPGATQIMAQALEEAGSFAAAAHWRSRLDSIQPGDRTNILAWATDSLKAGDAVAAERILSMLKPEPKDDAGYHAAAAAVAASKRDFASAEQHWAEAARLDPQEDQYLLRLAMIRLSSKNAGLHDSAVDTLKEISRKPAKGAEALRALLADATNYHDWGKAIEYADALIAEPSATFPDKLTRLATLRAMKSASAAGYLTELRNVALSNRGDLYLLFMWMNQNDLALMVSEWSRTLPPDIIAVPPTCVAVADAYVRSLEWQRLREYLDERPWGEWDYMRRAFLARALERLEEGGIAAQEWKDGIAAARSRGDSLQRLERMVRLAISWGWEQRAQEVMWTMANSPNCPRWMLDALWLVALENSDTAQLHKLAGMFVQVDSKSVAFRNNYAFYSLLIHSEEGNPHREVEKLYNANPGNARIAMTRGLSLYQQGKFAEAVAVTGSLPAEELKKPQIALYHAIFLTAAGDTARAADFLTVAQDWKMIPEEKTLMDRVKQSVAKAAEEQDIAEAAKVAKLARTAREAEGDKAVELARAARAAQAAKAAADATQPPSAAR